MFLFVYFCRDFLKLDDLNHDLLTDIWKQRVICCEVV